MAGVRDDDVVGFGPCAVEIVRGYDRADGVVTALDEHRRYVAHAPEGDVSLEPYAAVRAWLGRIQSLPGFVPMQATAK